MAYNGTDFYDNEEIFQTYMARRQRADNPNYTMEKPVILELMGDFTNQRILDLGCGDGAFGKELLAKGCKTYQGIEGSINMVNTAKKNLEGTNGSVLHADIENWDYPLQHYDLVISRLVLHYLTDIDDILRKIYRTLENKGRFVFSIEHPVITSCGRARLGNEKRQDWIVDNYFETGKRVTSWMGGEVIKYHRTIENYFMSLLGAGFFIESLREAEPQFDWFTDDDETFQRRKRIPLFLILSCRKA